ncbi:MAG: hypothetical protein ABSE77_07450 [Acidimicrobiales bacterium]
MSAGSALVPALLKSGDAEAAAREVSAALRDMFGLDVTAVRFTQDEYSLNSVSGRAQVGDGTTYFFKFHQEEGEQENVTEYYRARLLSDAGLPVEVPVATSSRPGAQMALYQLRAEPRMADVCAQLERVDGAGAALGASLLAARRELDASTARVLLETMRAPVASSTSASIHQLFYHRLADGRGRFPGARYLRYYLADPMFVSVAAKRWRVNGIEYRSSLSALAEQAAQLLVPASLAALPVVTAHGDDHHGNVWALEGAGGPALRLFDPAFAGADLPALLAPVKATFHNALAHPFWLYHPDETSARFCIESSVTADVVEVSDDAQLSQLRREVLDSAAELIWAPLLAEMSRRSLLPGNWRAIVRSALFCCPMLVTNLVAESRPAPVRVLGLARAVAAGSEPVDGADAVSSFLDRVAP